MCAKSVEFRSPKTVLAPKSIAIVGASERGAWPRQIYANLQEANYQGDIYLVNPRQSEVYGRKCYPSLADIAQPIDHAMVIVPAGAVPGILEDAAASNVKSATIYAAGIGDGTDPDSITRGKWVSEFIANHDLRIAGPNCMGGFSYRERLHAYPNTDLAAYPVGETGVLFQSGGTLQFFMKTGADRGLRYSYGFSTGNELDLDLADFFNYLVDDPGTKQIVLFIEGIRRPDAFMVAAGRALEAGKPVLAIKTGLTQKSRQAAQSHTGAIGGDYKAFLAMCERFGIVRCVNLDDLLETALAFQGGRLPKGPNIGVVTTSGGTVDLLYDYAELESTSFPDLTEETCARLQPLLQAGIEAKNPLDAGIPTTPAGARAWCEAILDQDDIHMLAYAGPLPKSSDTDEALEPLRTLPDYVDKPIIGFSRMCYQMVPGALPRLLSLGFPQVQGLQQTLRAMNALWFHAERRGKFPAMPDAAPSSALSPRELTAALTKAGITVPRSELAKTADEAVEIADSIGFPVVLKIESKDILHKTEAGGVKLNLANSQDVRDGAGTLLASATRYAPDAVVDGFLVQQQVTGIEAIVGVHEDPLYGPILLVGTGGVFVELMEDVELRMLPVTTEDIERMLAGLKLSRQLDGFRGAPPADRHALIATIKAIGDFYLTHRARIRDIEINPLMVRPEGDGAVAVDVRVIWQDGVEGE